MHNIKQTYYLPRSILSFILIVLVLFSSNSMIIEVNAVKTTPNKVPIIVSLGDSYSSGEGIEPFYGQEEKTKYKIKDEDWLAHRSQKSWSSMLTLTYGSKTITMSDHRNENWFFVASSGATTKHINKIKQPKPYCYKSQINNKATLPLQLDIFDEINKTVGENEVDYVTMTLGGNDAGFTDIVTAAATDIPYLNPSKVYEKVSASLEKTKEGGKIYNNLKKAYTDICNAAGKQAKVIVAGYPKLLDPKGSGFLFGEYDAKIINQAAEAFNDAIEKLVNTCQTEENMNIHFVSVEDAFEGHGAYSDEPFINEIKPLQSEDLVDYSYILLGAKPDSRDGEGNPKLKGIAFSPVSAYSMHPNESGARAYATCVQAEINKLKDSTTATTPSIETTVPTTEASVDLTGTYWHLAYGPTNGGNYIARFEENGTLSALNLGSQTFYAGKYSYNQNKLYIEVDYHSDYFDKISDNEFKVPEPVYIYNGEMTFYLSATQITDAQTIKEFKEKEIKAKTKTHEDDIFYRYIKENLTLSKAYPSDVENEKGLVSALVEDFDNNGTKEMVTFSITHDTTDQPLIVLNLYIIQNNNVVHVDTSTEIFISGGGNYQNETCAIFEDSLIKIQTEQCNSGGSSFVSKFRTFKVSNNQLILQNEYSRIEFARYNSFTYEETVSGTTYSSWEDFYSAVDKAGYNREEHQHVGFSESEFDATKDDYMTAECFKGNHIFVVFSSLNFFLSGEYTFIYDNTKLSEKLTTE